uniref:cGMP-dependent protein kinase n=1 Tax=Physcomitrium patens TaxID=3218 RepID=A0A7I4CQH2_PHYPA
MGCVNCKSSRAQRRGAKQQHHEQQHQQQAVLPAVNDTEDVFTSESDEDVFGDGLGMKMCLPGRDSKSNSRSGTPKLRSEANTPHLKSEAGTPKWGSKYIPGLPKPSSKSGTPRTRSDIGTPKLKTDAYSSPSVKPEGEGSKVGSPYELGSSRRNTHSSPHFLESLDLDLGISRLSRIADQYLPASGSRVVRVPDGDYELRFSYLTQRGYYPEALDKANQDSFCAHTVFERRGKNLVAVDLSTDQTPFRDDECARVKACGARIMTLDQLEGLKNPDVRCWGGEDDDDGDPPRLWVQNGMYPGTAFTRSLGDSAAEEIGVIAVPEVLVVDLTPQHPFFVVASDGVFEFINSQTVVDMVAKCSDPKEACAAIVAESYRLWLQYETRTDDITIIVVHIQNLDDDHIAMESYYRDSPVRPLKSPGVKSPGRVSRDAFKGNRPVRSDFSRARARAIEASLDLGEPWLPSTNPRVKTPEEEAQIKQALQGNFLFEGLTEKQRQTLISCMDSVEVNAGDIIIRQGFESDLFYIVESGEFEASFSQTGTGSAQDPGKVVHLYTADSNPCFGELALLYNKPGQATVRAATNGSLWVLEREAFRGALLMQYMQRPLLMILRSLEIFSKLSLSHLQSLSEALTEVTFQAGQVIVEKDQKIDALYITNRGDVDIIYHDGENNDAAEFQLPRASLEWTGERCAFIDRGDNDPQDPPRVKFFGDWVLTNMPAKPITVVATTDVECWCITQQAFENAVGPLSLILKEDERYMEKMSQVRRLQLAEVDAYAFKRITLKDLDWQETVYSTDCCEVGVVFCRKSDDIVSMKRYQRRKVQRLGREGQVLLERSLFKQLRPSPFVPHLLATPIDSDSVALVLNCVLAGPLDLLLRSPLDENSARYLVANVVLAIELLHKDGVVYRGISPDVLVIDRKGRLQLIDFRFSKKMSDERTFTVCGMADFLAPEVIQGLGHGLASDWWAVGVLMYFMLQTELPFGSWRDNELDVFGRIAHRQLTFPSSFSAEATDLIDKLLVVDPTKRLGCDSHGALAIKGHPWFRGVNWDKLLDCSVEVPSEIMTRLQLAIDFLPVDDSYQVFDLQPDEDDPPWLDGW